MANFELNVYVQEIADADLSQLRKGLEQYGMQVEFHEEASFDHQLGLFQAALEMQEELVLPKDRIHAGFDLDVYPFKYSSWKEATQEKVVKRPGGLSKILRTFFTADTGQGVPVLVDQRLKQSQHEVVFSCQDDGWMASYRMVWLMAGLLTTMKKGILFNAADGVYYDETNAMSVAEEQVRTYEEAQQEIRYKLFEGWLPR